MQFKLVYLIFMILLVVTVSNPAFASKLREGVYIGTKTVVDGSSANPLYVIFANKHITGILGPENAGVKVEKFDIQIDQPSGLTFTSMGNNLDIKFAEDNVTLGTAKYSKGSNKSKIPFDGYYFVADSLFNVLRSFINVGPDGSALISLELTQPHRFFGKVDKTGKFNLVFSSDSKDTTAATDFSGEQVIVSYTDSTGTFSQTMQKEKVTNKK